MWKRVMPVVMNAIIVRCDADIEAALAKFKSKMQAKFKDMVNRAAAADEQRAAKLHRTLSLSLSLSLSLTHTHTQTHTHLLGGVLSV